MLVQLSPSEWTANGSEVPLCQLPLSVADVEDRFPVKFSPQERQLPHYSHAVVAADGVVYLLAGARDAFAGPPHSYVSVAARGDVHDPEPLVDQICTRFSVHRDQLPWLSSELAPRNWLLFRLDDNGNQVPMWYFKDQGTAEGCARFYESRGHKQHYYVRCAAA
jgi:hypothetical protein